MRMTKPRMTKKRWIALLSALAIVLAAALTSAAVIDHGGTKAAEDDSPLLIPASTTLPPTTVKPKPVTSTTYNVNLLSKPIAPPADPYAPSPIIQLGVLEIPKIQEVTPIFEGITLTVIDHGPGHWPGSAMPGQPGNAVFPGHRVTHSHPFLNLDLLSPGDQIVFYMPHMNYVYKVTRTQIVDPTDLQVVNQTSTRTVTLIACHPKHSAAQRIVVTGTLAASIPSPT